LQTASKLRAEELLCRLGAYRPARNAYQSVFNREVYANRRQDRAFFRQFLRPGALAFDIGANEGRLTETFVELGARVIAIEPNPQLAARIRARYAAGRAGRVAVEAVAVGAEAGVATLQLGRDSEHSTLSADWQDALRDEGADGRWAGTVDVPVETLDRLIDRHGRPDFVKIDVEGFEPQVLSGLHSPVPALCFEFQCRAIALARTSVELVVALGAYEFNVGRPERTVLAADGWTGPERALEALESIHRHEPKGYGDVYARLAGE
jgi:FkbM family methyltransferase